MKLAAGMFLRSWNRESRGRVNQSEISLGIEQIIKKKKLTQVAAAKVMGINQPKVSALLRRKLDGFSVERLIHFLNTLGQDIDIVIRQKPASRKQARINVYHDTGVCNSARTIPMVAKGC